LPDKDHIYFGLLKAKIVEMMKNSYPGINSAIAEWKGQEITDFQEDLHIRANANISEKWFYTHMKTDQRTIPRIDMLNLLSRYAGYANWDDFVFRNSESAGQIPSVSYVNANPNRIFLLIPLLAVVIVLFFYGLFMLFNTQQYRFCFYDADTREPITNCNIEIRMLLEGESPVIYRCGPDGCFMLKTDRSKVKLVVTAQYYQTDTIVRILKKLSLNETINLHANDYALMIHYLSTMKVDDWEKRKQKLADMIDDQALIYQVMNDRKTTGTAMYNKQEFIDKMTMPAGSLRNIEILDSQLSKNKIVLLRFRINDSKR